MGGGGYRIPRYGVLKSLHPYLPERWYLVSTMTDRQSNLHFSQLLDFGSYNPPHWLPRCWDGGVPGRRSGQMQMMLVVACIESPLLQLRAVTQWPTTHHQPPPSSILLWMDGVHRGCYFFVPCWICSESHTRTWGSRGKSIFRENIAVTLNRDLFLESA